MGNKTIKRGYLKMKIDEKVSKWLHFSMNCWDEVKELTGSDHSEFGKRMKEAGESGDVKKMFDIYTDLAHGALRAYDLEEDNDINYNKYKVKVWLQEAMNDEKFTQNFISALTWNITVPELDGLGEDQPEESPAQ